MPDLGHELRFGTFLTPAAAGADRVVALARLSEDLGYDLVTVQDHPYQARFLDTWTLLSYLAAATTAVRLAPNVANLPLRPPVVLARSVASLDVLSSGRVELGLGAGAFLEGVVSVGGPRLEAASSVDALEEALDVVRAVWNAEGKALRFEGRHYRVVGAHPGPAPAHPVEVWLGAYRPRMLRLTGARADGWLPSSGYLSPSGLAQASRVIDEAAVDAGRSPSAVRRLYNVSGQFAAKGTGFLQGPPSLWAEQLAELALEHGTSTFIVTGDDPDDLRRFAEEVAPDVRERVAAHRGGAGETDPGPDAAEPAPAVTAASSGAAVLHAAGATTGVATPVPGLGVVPTPDDGVRLSAERPWDESTRPSGPPPDPGRAYSERERMAGQALVDIHDHLRGELAKVRDLVDQVTTGTLSPEQARSAIAVLTVRQNAWTVGAYCASYCRLLTTHHTIEDSSMLPHLREGDPRLGPVLDRLESEHHVIAGVLDRMDRALVAFVDGPEGARELRDAVDLLSDTLLSHLSYEERELVEPLARLGMH